MKSRTGLAPTQTEIEKVEQEIAPKSPEIEVAEVSKEELERRTIGEAQSDIEIIMTVLGFERKDLGGIIQRVRGKKNVRYINPKGHKFFTKYVNKKDGKRDNILGLKNEKYCLDLLADSGVHPKRAS